MKLPNFILALSTASIAWKLALADESAAGAALIKKCAAVYYTLYISPRVPINFLAVPDCMGSDCQSCPLMRFPGGKSRPSPLAAENIPFDLSTLNSYGPWDLESLLRTYQGASMDVPEKYQSDYIAGDLLNMANTLSIDATDVIQKLKSAQASGNAPTKGWTEMYIPYNPSNGLYADEFGDNKPYGVDDARRQHLHLFQAPSDTPTPVFIYAHAERTSAAMMPDPAAIAGAGFSIISWETVNGIMYGEDEIQTCLDDFELVWLWLQDNAIEYNLDTSSVVIGGSSRGTVCSWGTAHSEKDGVKGLYMVDALPDTFWSQSTAQMFTDTVTVNSPPLTMVYTSECGDIDNIKECDPDPNTGHNPKFGQVIIHKYSQLGIGAFAKLYDGLTNKDMGVWDLFPRFVATLSGNQDKVAETKLRASAAAEGNQ
jgi:hypothetical protein